MKKLEKILGAIAVLGLGFKIFHYPGAGPLTVLSFTFLSMLYFGFGFALFNGIRFRKIFKKESYRNITSKKIWGGIGLGIALSMCLIGSEFKLQFWPGAEFQLRVAIQCLALVVAIFLYKYLRRKEPQIIVENDASSVLEDAFIKKESGGNNFYLESLKRIAIIGGFSFVLFLIPMSTLIEFNYRDDPEYLEAYKEYRENPNSPEARERLIQLDEERVRKYQEDID